MTALTTFMYVFSLTAQFAMAEGRHTHRCSALGRARTQCTVETSGPATVDGPQGIVQYKPIPKTLPCNELHSFYADARCSSSTSPPSKPEEPRLQVQFVCFVWLCFSI